MKTALMKRNKYARLLLEPRGREPLAVSHRLGAQGKEKQRTETAWRAAGGGGMGEDVNANQHIIIININGVDIDVHHINTTSSC